MEAPEYFHGGYYKAGAPQLAPEKQGKAGGDHFIVEDLLDFPNEEEDENGIVAGDDGGVEAAAGNSTDSSTVTAVDSCNSSFSGGDQHFSGELVCQSLADASLSGDLCEPYDELAELEWLSNFVEESFSSEDLQKLQLISGVKSASSSETLGGATAAVVPSSAGNRSAFPQPPLLLPPDSTAVPGKARSKRSRAAPCDWSSRLLVLSQSSSSDSTGGCADDVSFVKLAPNSIKKTPKPSKKKEGGVAALAPASDGRKCLHCATDKTPQWRTGPLGPKTLCNACGVRYKSGRLVPEYRPAASPTFVLSKHSNSHRKVLELRRQKEVQPPPYVHPGAVLFDGAAGEVAASSDEFLIHHHLGPDFRQLI